MVTINIKLIDFDHFYRSHIHLQIMNALFAYGLLKDGTINLRKREVKKLFENFVRHYVLEYKPKDPWVKEVFVVFPDILRDDTTTGSYSHIQIFEYVNKSSFRKLLKPIIESMYQSRPDLIFLGKREALLTNPDLLEEVFYTVNQFN